MEFVSVKAVQKMADKTPTVVMPIGDIQWAGKKGSTALDLLRRRIDKGMQLGAYFLGMGDYIDFLSPSNRQRLRSAALYDTAEDVIDEKAMELVYELYELALKPTVGRWLGLLEGHHFTQLKTGDTTDMRLCQMLKTHFLGTSAYVRMQFFNPAPLGDVFIWCHHGCGGGMKTAAPLNKLENILPYWDADIFVMGHMTKMATAPINRIYPTFTGTPHLQHRKIMLVGAGGFSKGYVERSRQGLVPRDGYVAQRMLNPASLGNPIIRILPVQRAHFDNKVRTRAWEPEISVEL